MIFIEIDSKNPCRFREDFETRQEKSAFAAGGLDDRRGPYTAPSEKSTDVLSQP